MEATRNAVTYNIVTVYVCLLIAGLYR